jgi:PAS domain S-box-containing protein
MRDLEVHMGRFGNRALVVFSDLTERKHTEELLRKSEERYRLIVETQTEFIVKWRPDGTRTFVNDSYCRTFGVREQDCVGTSFLTLVAPEHREAVRRRTAALTPKAPEYTDEHASLVPDGRRWQQWTNRGIFDADGRLVEILSTGRDISERKEAEEKLRQSRMHLVASQHIARVGSWEMDLQSLDDLDENSLRCSDECFRIFGLKPGEIEVTGRVFFDLVHPDDRDKVRHAALRAVRRRSLYSIDHRILLASGDERVVHGQAELMLDAAAGRPVKLIGTIQDVTNRVRLEEQLRQSQKMQAIGQLAGGVAHDFNNLLTVVNGHVEMVLDHLVADDPMRGELTPIRDAGQRAALLTRQLLLFSRKAVLEPRVLNCGDVVQRTSQMLQRLISEEIEISIVLAPALDRVKADPSQIEQVIMNLSLNACDAMPRGGRLKIETRNAVADDAFCREHPEAVPGRYVQLIVSDTGCGMTPQVKAHLFEPFFTTKGPGRGTGLGLATVYGIVQESRGFVTVSSEVNIGTTFNVFLPALEGPYSSTAADAVDHAPLRGNETVLVVEDDPDVRTITTLALAKYGYRVLEASGGPAALRMSNDRETIDLLVTDVVMPEMSGRRLADALLRTRPHCRVLFMSGYNEEMLADRAANSPGDAFIQKPFTPVALATKVREVLDRRTDPAASRGSIDT